MVSISSGMDQVIFRSTMALRVVRDDGIISFSADLRHPDRLQQAWQGEDGTVEWRDVEVIGLSKLTTPRAQEKEPK